MENNRQNENGIDDDFDDFGGFEAADPVEPAPANGGNAGVSAGPNPWAVMYPPAATGSRSVQPDLLCGQNRFPQHLDTPLTVDVAGSAEASVQPGPADHLGQEGGAVGFDPDLDFNIVDGDADFDLDNINLANDILDGSFRSTGSNQPGPGPGLANHGPEQLPDISGLDLAMGISANSSNRPELVSNADSVISANSNNAEHVEVPSDRVTENQASSSSDHVDNGANAEAGNQSDTQEVAVVDNSQGATGEEVGVSGAESAALQRETAEKEELRQKLERFELENVKLAEDLARAQELADAAKASCEELQRSHETQLEDLRQAGHQSLAVVVGEYRELMAAAGSQQQVACEQQLGHRMKEEAERFTQILHIQKEEFEKLQVEERKKQEEKLSKALEEMKQKEQEQFDKQLAEERSKSEEMLKAEIQKERESSAREIQRVIEEERRKAQELLENEKENFRKELDKEVDKSREELKKAMKEQQEQNQETMSAMLEEERCRSRETLQQTVEAVRGDLHGFLDQQRQSERAVQRRHFASLDLFLESARQQLRLLMDTNNKPDNTSDETDNTAKDKS